MSKASILIVEDEAIVAADLANKLCQLGYAITGTTARGEEAVTMARDRRPDLVLLDIHLAGPLDGVAAAAMIRRSCDVPVIYLTAHADRATLDRAKLTEPFGYLLKPFQELEVQSHIEMALYKHQAERRLRESESRFRQAHERLVLAQQSAGAGVWEWEIPGGRLDWSPELFRLFGLDPATAHADFETWRGVVHPEDRQMAQDHINAAIRARTRLANEYRIVLPTGEVRWICALGNVIIDTNGEPLRMSGICLDITESKQAEHALARTQEELRATNAELAVANEELAARNKELAARNEELAARNEDLRVATEQLQANAEQLELLAEELRVSNDRLEARVDLRTAQLRELATELTQTEERERERIAKILHDHLQQFLVGANLQLGVLCNHTDPQLMRDQAERVRQLIVESLEISRGLTQELSPPVLHDLGLAAALKWLGGWMADKHGLTVRVQADTAAEPLERSVQVLLFQSVRELLLNVVKHAGVSRASVRMSLREDDRLEVLVSDQGRGFDPSQATPGRSSGGFGLFSIRERLALLGGRMEVESKPGHGARFRLIAPLHETAALQPSSPPHVAAAQANQVAAQ